LGLTRHKTHFLTSHSLGTKKVRHFSQWDAHIFFDHRTHCKDPSSVPSQ